MSKLFSTDIDLQQNEIKKARLENLASAPLNPLVGQLYFNTTESTFKYWNGSVWNSIDEKVQATETLAGVSEIATQVEVHAGTDDLRYITPLKLESEKGIADGIVPLDASGKIDGSYLSGGGKSMVVSFAAGTDTGLTTSTVGYTRQADMIYAGSSVVGPILNIKATIWKSDINGATGQIRIINKVNADVICELTGIINTDDALVLDLGTLTNIPLNSSTFEIQMGRSTGSSRDVECSSIEIVY